MVGGTHLAAALACRLIAVGVEAFGDVAAAGAAGGVTPPAPRARLVHPVRAAWHSGAQHKAVWHSMAQWGTARRGTPSVRSHCTAPCPSHTTVPPPWPPPPFHDVPSAATAPLLSSPGPLPSPVLAVRPKVALGTLAGVAMGGTRSAHAAAPVLTGVEGAGADAAVTEVTCDTGGAHSREHPEGVSPHAVASPGQPVPWRGVGWGVAVLRQR